MGEEEMRQQVRSMEEDFRSEQNTTFAVTADMARQYKALQDDLIHRINSLETTLTEQKERMEDMSTEFASMLNQTLRLMKEHANEKLSGEGFEEKTDYGARLQEYSAKAYAAVTAGPS